MKTLVVYYSLEGNTELVVETAAEAAGADLLRIVPKESKAPRGLTRYIWGGRAALSGSKPELKPLQLNPEDYDTLIVGTPVWAWTFAPAMNTFFSMFDFTGKRVALFCCHGGQPGKTLEKMKKAMEGASFIGETDLRDPLKHQTEEQLEDLRHWVAGVLEKA
jgi:flavodoxin